jgi:hypothetical protein
VLAATGCGDSLDEVNRLAARGAIHDGAPVTAHVVMRIAAPPDSVRVILGTTVKVRESMDGPLMSTFVSSSRLAETDNAWIAALKRAAERRSTS